MLNNYLKMTWRTLLRNRLFSVINILGLTLGLTCSLIILLWIRDERSVDNFHINGDRLYTIVQRQFINGKPEAGYFSPGVLASELKRVIPEIELASGFAWTNDEPDLLTFEAAGKSLKFESCYADSDYFKMFSYPLVEGNAATALAGPTSICISEKMANAFFGNHSAAIGKIIRFDNKKDLKVTGVFKNLPANASNPFECLLNWEIFLSENEWAREWGNSGPNTLLMLRENADPNAVRSRLKKFLDNYNKQQSTSFYTELDMQRFGDSYLHGNFENGQLSGGRIEYVQLFTIVAIFILCIACVNFMNLTTARSLKRGKEIGIRKVTGATRKSLAWQFLAEAVTLTFFSVMLALVFTQFLLPYFNQLTGKKISLPLVDMYFWLSLAGITLVTGLISGSYPALFLSSFKPITVLKGIIKFGTRSLVLRKGLVVFQFVLSVILITATIVVSRQVDYLQTTSSGFQRENLIYIHIEGELSNKYDLFKKLTTEKPGIKMVSRMGELPTNIGSNTGGVDWPGKTPNTTPMFINTAVGYDFVKTLGLEMAAGREFSKDFISDSSALIINESALKVMGLKNPVGTQVEFWGRKGNIVGVVKDFYFSSLHQPVKPLILRNGENYNWGNIIVRTEARKTHEAIANLQQVWERLNPKYPFTFRFSNEEYQKLYDNERVVRRLSNYFAFLSVFICCLGLLGLAIFAAEQRTKEIGIRKVLGASAISLLALLSKEFFMLITLAMLIGFPVAWWAMNDWLGNFAYKIDIEWWMFGSSALLIIAAAIVTISYQSARAVLVNPVDSLHAE
jgi:ABC-type antimicrobial peptide transport system permease subunit